MCGCCDSDFCDCLKNVFCILGIVVGIVFLTGVALIIAIFGGPLRKIKVTVEDGTLTRFDLLGLGTPAGPRLAYNLSVGVSVRNPNWAIGIKYDKPLEAAYSFDGQRFDRAQAADKGERLRARKTVVYRLRTDSPPDGRPVALGNAGEAEFRKQNATRVFEVEVKITGKFRYQLRKTKCEFEVNCPMKLQVPEPGASAVVFQKVDCKLAKTDDKYCKMVY